MPTVEEIARGLTKVQARALLLAERNPLCAPESNMDFTLMDIRGLGLADSSRADRNRVLWNLSDLGRAVAAAIREQEPPDA